jgi:acetyl esterase/lipase
MGNRHGVPRRLVEVCRDEGFVLVSLDYRLAPEVKLPAIIEDVKDAFRWIRRDGPRLFHIDPDKIVVSGGSAGGYLTMMTGICVEPRPTALVAYWGYGDVDGTWYTKPSPFYRRQMDLIAEDEARGAVGREVISGTDRAVPEHKNRGRYYLWLRQNGLWTKEVTGFDPETQRDQITPYCPVRNITPDYPPLMMVHGTQDNDVPHQLSADMAKELARHQVPHELISVPDAGHGLSEGDGQLVNDAHDRALKFILEHLN